MTTKTFHEFWADQASDLPTKTVGQRKILLIAKGWAVSAWEAANKAAEEKFSTANIDMVQCEMHKSGNYCEVGFTRNCGVKKCMIAQHHSAGRCL